MSPSITISSSIPLGLDPSCAISYNGNSFFFRLRAEGLQQRKAVAVGQVHIQHDEIRRKGGKCRARFGGRPGEREMRIPRAAQRLRHQLEQLRLVIDKKDARILTALHETTPLF